MQTKYRNDAYREHHKKWYKEWRIKNYDKYILHRREYYKTTENQYGRKNRAKLIELLGGKCIKCGFTDVRALQVDHINGNGHKQRKERSTRQLTILYLKNFEFYKTELQLLCANCNWIKRYENKEGVKHNPYKPILVLPD